MDAVRPVGQLEIDVYEDGQFSHRTEVKNLVVAGGLRWIANMLSNRGGPSLNGMAVGAGNAAVNKYDQGLQSQLALSAATTGVEEVTTGSPSLVINAFFDAGVGTGTVTELALFLDNGTMVARTVIPGQPKGSTTSIRVKWTITFTS